jgi:hypothetical protein
VNSIFQIGPFGCLILGLQLAVFFLLLGLGMNLSSGSQTLRAALSKCLRESKDLITEKDPGVSIARSCATRYRIAAARVERVDAYSISSSEVSRATASVFVGRRWSYSQVDDLLHGGPGFLVTLGLIGTFVGLIGNMTQLSQLVLASEGAPEQTSLLQGLAALFPSMAAAFTTSLMGVSLSSILWLVGASNGMLSIKHELTELLSGYLEQVVQADCRRYSLVGESMERMEQYLSNYLSEFSAKVSAAIEAAIRDRIGQLVASLSGLVSETRDLIHQIREDSARLHDASAIFYRASKVLSETDFADQFGIACSSYLEHVNALAKASENVLAVSIKSKRSSEQLSSVVLQTDKALLSLSESLANSNASTGRLADLAIVSNNNLVTATSSIENVQKRGMTWLSMRAKTDKTLLELTQDMKQVIATTNTIAQEIHKSGQQEAAILRQQLSAIASRMNLLVDITTGNDNRVERLRASLEQLQVAIREAANTGFKQEESSQYFQP